MTMNIATEAHLAGKPIAEKPKARPVRMVRWFIIVGLLLGLLTAALIGFNAFRDHAIKQFFAGNKAMRHPASSPVGSNPARKTLVFG